MVLFKTTKVPRKTIHILVVFVQLYGFVGSPGGKEWRIGVSGLVEEDGGEEVSVGEDILRQVCRKGGEVRW
jgi:hypothetical protein